MEDMVIQGRNIRKQDVTSILEIMILNPNWGRSKISQELCRRWQWQNPNGQLKDMSCRNLLLKLEKRGLINLPPRLANTGSHNKTKNQLVLHDKSPIQDKLKELKPIKIVVAASNELAQLFHTFLDGYHYLGYQRPVGKNLKYLIYDSKDRSLGCLLFGAAAWKTKARDQYIGWEITAREKNLQLITNNTRFLILPWVKVPHLASHLLGLIGRRIKKDWFLKYGEEICLLETFVDTEKFKGTCYKAANWIHVGQTTGRTRQDRHHNKTVSIKDTYLYPLHQSFRTLLRGVA